MKSRFFAVFAGLLLSGIVAAADPHWEIQYQYRQIDSTLSISDIVFMTETRGVVCGFTTNRNGKETQLVLTTRDAGAHWTEAPLKEPCVALFFLDDSTGWMVTEKGIWETAESGRTWTKLRNAPAGMLRVWFLDRNHGFAAGLEKRVMETTNGGESWTLVPVAEGGEGDPTYTTYGEIGFTEGKGIIAGWNVPPRLGGPDWMEPDRAARRKQVPNLTILLQTIDSGKTWQRTDTSIFGQVTRLSLAPQGVALGLLEYKDQFEVPSEVYRIDTGVSGSSTSVFKQKDRAITDVRTFAGTNRWIIAGYETEAKVYRSPIPGRLKVLVSDDQENWTEMMVDYRAVAHRAMIAGPDEKHLWIATDTGMILRLAE